MNPKTTPYCTKFHGVSGTGIPVLGVYEGLNYPFGHNGKMKENELYGEGNGYDFGARMYDSRIGRWFSVDPLFNKYSFESNYLFTSDNPLLFIYKEGKDKYLYVIVMDGDKVIATTTYLIQNNQVKLFPCTDTYNSIDCYSTDVKQTITVDIKTKKWTVSEETADFSHRHSFLYGLRKWVKSATDKSEYHIGKQLGGWTFTAEKATTADGPKTKATKGSSGETNIDLILAAFSITSSEKNIPDLKGLGKAEFTDLIRDLSENLKELKEQLTEKKKEKTPRTRYYWDNGTMGKKGFLKPSRVKTDSI